MKRNLGWPDNPPLRPDDSPAPIGEVILDVEEPVFEDDVVGWWATNALSWESRLLAVLRDPVGPYEESCIGFASPLPLESFK